MKRTVTVETGGDFKRRKSVGMAATAIQQFYRKKSKNVSRLFDSSAGVPERKSWKAINSNTSASYTPAVQLVNLVDQGTQNTQRVGSKIRITALQVRAQFGAVPSQLATWEALGIGGRMCRLLFVYDNQPNGALPSLNQILDDTGSSSTYFVVASRNQNYIERFDVLLDETFVLGSAGPNVHIIDRYIKMSKESVWANSATGVISGMIQGSIVAFVVDNNGTGANPTYYQWQAKFTFTDD